MKGIILHGGHGTRLRPLTHTGPKQLLPIANKPMSQFCLEAISETGISEIAIIVGGVGSNKVREYYGDGKKFGVKIIKSISVSNENDLKKINNYQNADYFLFDYKPKKNELPGGNSKSFDWNILKGLKTDKPWFLSGGINLDNIQQILVDINPYGVDLSSGVEKELGIKDNRIINNFIEKNS